MASKHNISIDVHGNTCKGVYKRFQTLLKSAGVPMDKVEQLLSSNDYDEALAGFAVLLGAGKWSHIMANLTELCGHTILNDIFDIMWFYRRNLHFRIENIPDVDVFNTSILSEVNRDICLDIQLGEDTFCVYLFHRDYPIQMKRDRLDWTAQVFAYTPSILSTNHHTVAKTASSPSYTIHFEASENTRRCYLEYSPNYQSDCEKTCSKCEKCSIITTTYNSAKVNLRLYPFKYRLANGCNYNECQVTLAVDKKPDKQQKMSYKIITPTDVVKCIIHSLDCYKSRETITRKNGKKAAAYNACKVHIASKRDNVGDKIVMLPLHEYVKEYRASHPHEYKGGHHASPVAHMRRGYYRKARKHGDYVKKGDEFIYVGNREGDYCFVRATQVNNKTYRVIIYKTT